MDPIESYIRSAASQRGIDPDQAVRVARSEGLNSYTGDSGSSFGPFQLHYGNVAPGGNAVSGLGDVFTQQTGLDARDPNTVKQQIDFSLDHAAQNGWGAWHGWQGDPWAGINRPMAKAFNQSTGTTMPDGLYAAAAQPQPSQAPVLFGGNPTPIGAIGALGRMLGIGSEPQLGNSLKNAGAALMSVGNFGQDGARGAAAMQMAANEPHFDVVSDALGNRYVLDKRTGAISQPQAQIPQQGQSSGDATIDAVANSPAGALARSKEQIEQSVKDKSSIDDSTQALMQLRDLATRQMALSTDPTVVQGPGLSTMLRHEIGEKTNGALGGMDLNKQGEFDTNNLTIQTLLGKDLLNNARIAGPELRFLQMAHPNNDLTPQANQALYQQIIQKVDRQLQHAQIARKYPVLGPAYYNEVNAFDKQNPIYTAGPAAGPNSGAPANRPPLSSFQK